jgi:hypothetical protein
LACFAHWWNCSAQKIPQARCADTTFLAAFACCGTMRKKILNKACFSFLPPYIIGGYECMSFVFHECEGSLA